jgi:hypothetical protein
MKIKKGLKYVCIKKIINQSHIIFKKGVIYNSPTPEFLLDEYDCKRYVSSEHKKGYFVELK